MPPAALVQIIHSPLAHSAVQEPFVEFLADRRGHQAGPLYCHVYLYQKTLTAVIIMRHQIGGLAARLVAL